MTASVVRGNTFIQMEATNHFGRVFSPLRHIRANRIELTISPDTDPTRRRIQMTTWQKGRHLVQVSQDLQSWTSITNFPITHEILTISPLITSQPTFYRVREQPFVSPILRTPIYPGLKFFGSTYSQ